MKRTKRILALVLVIVLCAAVFSACGEKGGNTPTTTPAPDKPSTPAATNAPAPTDAPPAAEEVVYNMTVSFEEAWWDPALFTQANDTGLGPMIYETLVQYNEDGSVSPQLAESWDISDDGLTYTFHLRKGVQWHKGYGEFTSADVKFSLERHGDPAVASINAQNIKLDNIDSIECPDDYTVVIKLKAIDVDLLTRLGLYFSFIVCKAHNDKDGTASINTDPIGTGPFVFDGGTLGIRTEAVANKEWWGDRKGGNIDRIVNTFMNDTNTIYAAFDAGEVDSIGVYDYDKVAEYEAAGYTHSSVKEAPVELLSFKNEEDIQLGLEMKVIGDIENEAAISVTYPGLAGVTQSGRFRSIHIVGGEVVSNELKDVSGNGFLWGSGSAGSTCVPAASATNDQGWYSCVYSDNLLTWFKPDLTIGKQLNGYGDGTDDVQGGGTYVDSTTSPNNLDTKGFNNARYLALFVSNHFPKWWPGPQLYVYDITSGSLQGDNIWNSPGLVFSKPFMYNLQYNTGGHDGNGACGDVILAHSADGYMLYIYYYDHYSQMLGGYSLDCIKR